MRALRRLRLSGRAGPGDPLFFASLLGTKMLLQWCVRWLLPDCKSSWRYLAQRATGIQRTLPMNEPDVIREMLAAKTLAVVGLSDNPGKASHSVSAHMQGAGYRILPVNPALTSMLGERCYPSLEALAAVERPDLVNVFRLPQYIPAIVDEMVALGLKQLWVQLGIVNTEAAAKAEAAGIRVVMDRCILVEHARLGRR